MTIPWLPQSPTSPALATHLLGEFPAVSPDGTLIAWLPARKKTNLVERERVIIETVRGGEVVCTLPGPQVVRTLLFVSNTHLLTARDSKGGTLFSLHELPLGETIAEYVLHAKGEHRPTLVLSPDRSVLLIHGPWEHFESIRPIVALDAATLSQRWILSEDAIKSTALVSNTIELVLHPDGAQVAITGGKSRYETRNDSCFLWTGPPLRELLEFPPPDNYILALAWTGPDEQLIALGSYQDLGNDQQSSFARIRVYRVSTNLVMVPVHFPEEHKAQLASFSPDGSYFLSLTATADPILDENQPQEIDPPAENTLQLFRVENNSLHRVLQHSLAFRWMYDAGANQRSIAWNHEATVAIVLQRENDSLLVLRRTEQQWTVSEVPLQPSTEYVLSVELLHSQLAMLRTSNRSVQIVPLPP